MADQEHLRQGETAGRPATVNQRTDQDRASGPPRQPSQPTCGIDRCFVSESGYVLILGWMADEGRQPYRIKLAMDHMTIDVSPDSVLRHSRSDLEKTIREGAFDYGLIAFAKVSSPILESSVSVRFESPAGDVLVERPLESLSERRILDSFLVVASMAQSHAGKEVSLGGFLRGPAGSTLSDLHRKHVAQASAGHHVQRFRQRPVARSFVTVLFGSTEAIALQPLLFKEQGIDFGEWIYVCNSPDDAGAALRLAQTMSDLYDLSIVVIIVSDNVGFGAANNIAVGHASSGSIYLVNPDVYPLPAHSAAVRDTLDQRALGDKLWGGLLFYDDDTLMHGGMFIEQDLCFGRHGMNRPAGPAASAPFGLLRVEHFDKGVPFAETRWTRPRVVPAVTGALMAFDRRPFERVGGFSSDYIYGHYEDADLSLRWPRHNGPVVIDPRLRLAHLEGQGSRVRGEQYGAAALVNRYLFSLRHGAQACSLPGPRDLTLAEQ